jgi:RNA polymerase sigma factor (sigma-70 family)
MPTGRERMLGKTGPVVVIRAMRETDLSPETQVLVDNFVILKNRDNEVPAACWQSLLRIAEWGINSAAPGLTIDQKKERQDLAITELYKGLASLKDGEHMANRLRLIAKRKAIDLIKSYAFKNTYSLQAIEEKAESDGGEIVVAQLVSSDTPLDQLERTEKHSLVNEALERVGAECHELLVLKYSEGVSREKIADMFSIGIDAVDKRLQKCKRLWKQIYEKISEMHSKWEEEEAL